MLFCSSHIVPRKRDCPICREEVIGIRPNHTMAKIVNVYLRLNPSLDRPQLEKETCDLVNVISGSIVSFGVLVMFHGSYVH